MDRPKVTVQIEVLRDANLRGTVDNSRLQVVGPKLCGSTNASGNQQGDLITTGVVHAMNFKRHIATNLALRRFRHRCRLDRSADRNTKKKMGMLASGGLLLGRKRRALDRP